MDGMLSQEEINVLLNSGGDSESTQNNLTDEEKDARDYQLQRAMEMVIAMDTVKSRSISSPTDVELTEDVEK